MALMGGGGRPFRVSMVAATDSSRRGNDDNRRWRVRWPGFSLARGDYDPCETAAGVSLSGECSNRPAG